MHYLARTPDEDVQYVRIEAIPTDDDVTRFSFRLSTAQLRELQPRLHHPVRVPEHLALMPTLIERFVNVFKQYVDQNPVHYVDQVWYNLCNLSHHYYQMYLFSSCPLF